MGGPRFKTRLRFKTKKKWKKKGTEGLKGISLGKGVKKTFFADNLNYVTVACKFLANKAKATID